MLFRSDEGADYAVWQYSRFKAAMDAIGEDADRIPFRQLANTPGCIALPDIRMSGICPGRAMWGYSPLTRRAEHPELKAPLVLHEIMGNKNMSEILRPMIKEKFMDMNYKMAEMYMEDIGEVIQLLPRYAVPSVIATLKLILEALEKDMTEKDKMVAQEIKERGAVAIIRHKIK